LAIFLRVIMLLRLPFPIFERILACLVLMLCAGSTMLMVAAYRVDPDPMMVIGMVIFTPFAVFLFHHQFRSTFHRSGKSAWRAGIFIGSVAALVLFGYVANVVEDADSEGLLESARLLWPMPIAFFLIAIAAGSNIVQAKRLEKLPVAVDRYRGYTLRDAAFIVGGCLLLFVGSVALIGRPMPRFAEHVGPDAVPYRLPPEASDVTYRRGHRGTFTMEFTIDEAAFRRWVDSAIRSRSKKLSAEPIQEIEGHDTVRSVALQKLEEKVVTNGLRYAWHHEDHAVYATYDRDAGRAYYHTHSH